jgi:hypothetical protein
MSAAKLARGHRQDIYLMANARSMLSRKCGAYPNWVLAMHLFATGSTSAFQICDDAGIDPESTKIDIAEAGRTLAARVAA